MVGFLSCPYCQQISKHRKLLLIMVRVSTCVSLQLFVEEKLVKDEANGC